MATNSTRRLLRFLIVDGYTVAGREELMNGGASTAGILYDRLLRRSCNRLDKDITIETKIIYPADDEHALDIDLKPFHGIAWTGCSLTIYSGESVVQRQIDFQRKIFAAGRPSFGSCWATQIAAVASGGECCMNPNGREMGLARKIHLSPEGRAHPMYEGKPLVFDAFTSHEDMVCRIPRNAQILASNWFTNVQALSVTNEKSNFWSVQYHPEYDLHELARLTYCRKEKLVKKGFFNNVAAAEKYVEEIEMLHEDPTRKDLAWKYGIDHDVMNEEIRTIETVNWVKYEIIPQLK